MPIAPTWLNISIRLLCAIVAGAAIGLNRTEHGRAAGLRTSILVCLAACIAMIQMNLLLPLAGRGPSSFVMNDLMRLPLGILSGMGFIGAGAIVRRENIVLGVTTAASLWFLTVVGLCVGGGQIVLGLVGTALGVSILSGLGFLEDRLKQDRQGRLLIVTNPSGPHEDEIRTILERDGFRIVSWAFTSAQDTNNRKLSCDLHWRAKRYEAQVPEFVRLLAARADVARITWTPHAS
ncbi:MAG TPA: MgtC/SapB family protein [Bryobacteraceae bacterium]|jgi:putative Mg2+ transporter-C (MgtC) family protein|nr:MgtC/SapB family protein [Bryobacteraceae bacterium]